MADAGGVFDEQAIAEIAREAEADPRSVWKRLAGGEVRGRVQARIDRAIVSVRGRLSGLTIAADRPGTVAGNQRGER